MVALDHYYSVADDSAETAAEAARQITAIGTAMLESLRRTAEIGAVSHLLTSGPDSAASEREAS